MFKNLKQNYSALTDKYLDYKKKYYYYYKYSNLKLAINICFVKNSRY